MAETELMEILKGGQMSTRLHSQDIREGNLANDVLMAYDFVNNESLTGMKAKKLNLMSDKDWDYRNGTYGDFPLCGASGDNKLVRKVNPWGAISKMWATESNDAASDADGGFNPPPRTIDRSFGYRFSVWIRRENAGNGNTYFGVDQYSVTSLGSDVANSNPYFCSGEHTMGGGLNDQWKLFVAYVHPSDYVGTEKHKESGIYDIEGNKITTTTDYKWTTTAVEGGMRSYLYYSTNTTERQYWFDPRIEKDDGTLIPIQDYILSGTKDAVMDHEKRGRCLAFFPSFPDWLCENLNQSNSVLMKSVATSAWDTNFRSEEFMRGDMYIEWRVDYRDQTSKGAEIVGISQDTPTGTSGYASIDYAIYTHENGNIYIKENNVTAASFIGIWDFSTTKKFRIEVRNRYVRYFYGDNCIWESTVRVDTERKFYAVGSLHCHGNFNYIRDLTMGRLENGSRGHKTFKDGLYCGESTLENINRTDETFCSRTSYNSNTVFPIEPPIEVYTKYSWTSMRWDGDILITDQSKIAIGDVLTICGWYLPYTTDLALTAQNTRSNGLQMYDADGSLGYVSGSDGDWNKWKYFSKTITVRNLSNIRIEDRGHDYYDWGDGNTHAIDKDVTSAYMCNVMFIKKDHDVPFIKDMTGFTRWLFPLCHTLNDTTIMIKVKSYVSGNLANRYNEIPNQSSMFAVNGYDTVNGATGTLYYRFYSTHGNGANPFADANGCFGTAHAHSTYDIVADEFTIFINTYVSGKQVHFIVYPNKDDDTYYVHTTTTTNLCLLNGLYFNATNDWDFSVKEVVQFDRYLVHTDRREYHLDTITMEMSEDHLDINELEEEENLWPNLDPYSTSYSVWGMADITLIDDPDGELGICHETSLAYTYEYAGFDIATEVGSYYLFTAEIYYPTGATGTYRPIAIEGMGTPSYKWTGFTMWRDNWTNCWAVAEATDGAGRFLIYPCGSTAGSGVFRWRNVSVTKISAEEFEMYKNKTKLSEAIEWLD